ncbi:response regulator [Salaquimonas pukyongi]|uniref:response regulator n=1 Tax=Salaquimonas pukyongi TaxID=2712698 RepID=UPI00096B8870|nr:response regulator transcription factor [Salaquimonas pukyongi]
MSKTVIIADNHPVFRNGVRQILGEANSFDVLAEVGDGEACIYQAGVLKPDAIVMDLNMPGMGGFEAAEKVLEIHPACRIVILSMYSSAEFVARAREIGCHGFVAKEDAGDELIKAMSVNSGGFFMSSSTGTAGEDVLGNWLRRPTALRRNCRH